MGHRTHDGNLVGHLGRFFHNLAVAYARKLGADIAELAAVGQGSVGLGVEGVLMRHAAGKEDVDDALGRTFLALVELLVGACGLNTKVIIEGQAQPAQNSDLQEVAAGCLQG